MLEDCLAWNRMDETEYTMCARVHDFDGCEREAMRLSMCEKSLLEMQAAECEYVRVDRTELRRGDFLLKLDNNHSDRSQKLLPSGW